MGTVRGLRLRLRCASRSIKRHKVGLDETISTAARSAGSTLANRREDRRDERRVQRDGEGEIYGVCLGT